MINIKISQLEAEIRKQREATNQLLQGLDYDSQAKYMQMKEANFELQQKAEQLQSQVNARFYRVANLNHRDDFNVHVKTVSRCFTRLGGTYFCASKGITIF